jgi:dipeptidyl-peptidase 4
MKKLVLSLLLILPFLIHAQNSSREISLEDIYKARKFASKGIGELHSMNSGDEYCQVKHDSLNIYKYTTGDLVKTLVTSKQLIPAGDTTPLSMAGFGFSEDEHYLLFTKDEEPIYRHSSRASYFLYELSSGKLKPLSDKGKQMFATFSPDGGKIAFVRDNNLFVVNTAEVLGQAPAREIQVTKDGRENEIINGRPDWVYEEEFDMSKAFSWSPDSKKLAFTRFDESRVKEFQLTEYGELYPEYVKYKYPKPGEANSVVSVFVYDLASAGLKRADIGNDTDIYIPRVIWSGDPGKLFIYRMNRHQDRLEILLADAGSGSAHTLYTEENNTYIEINDDLYCLKNNQGFLLTSEKNGFNHIYHFGMDGRLVKQLTDGQWDVRNLVGVDEAAGLVYFLSSETSPLNNNLYSVTLDGKTRTRLTRKEGTFRIDFSKTFRYFVSNFSDINTPPRITVNDRNGDEIRVMQENRALLDIMAQYNFGKVEFFTFRTSDNTELNGWKLLPPGFDPKKKYPVLFYVYGGPGSQTVVNRWGGSSSWNQLLAQHDIIVMSVDNRGTGARGEAFRKCTYLNLGKYETLDQIEAAKYASSLPYVDKDRIGIWGWSYGGFMTLSCLTVGADYFKMGIAVAPVTNFKYYDDIYTERYMRTPAENPTGYESNSPITNVSQLKGKLLLIHGMADDNVHAQNSYDFITAMIATDKQFEMQLYPNSNHGIYTGKGTTLHLYQRMTGFILKNL